LFNLILKRQKKEHLLLPKNKKIVASLAFKSIHTTSLSLSIYLSRSHKRLTSKQVAPPSIRMAAGLSTAVTFKPLHRSFSSSSTDFRLRLPKSLSGFSPSLRFKRFSVCYVVEERRQNSPIENDERPESTSSTNAIDAEYLALRLAEKLERKKSERSTYLIAAMLSSFGITSMAVMAVYYRFSWQMEV